LRTQFCTNKKTDDRKSLEMLLKIKADILLHFSASLLGPLDEIKKVYIDVPQINFSMCGPFDTLASKLLSF